MPALSTTAKREFYCEIGNAMPPPVLHNQEYHDRRLTAAVEVFEALRPGDAYEARLAVQVVLTGAHAAECLREAGVFREDYAKRTRCRAQAAGMMRAEAAARRALAQEQKIRLATEAVANATRSQPASSSASPSHAGPQTPPSLIQVAALAPPPVQPPAAVPPLVQSAPLEPEPVQAAAVAPHALQSAPLVPEPLPVAATAPPPGPVQPAVAPPHSAATQTAQPPAAAVPAPPPTPEAIAMAEAYVEENLVAAAQIRQDRGVTPQSRAYFRHLTLPTDPALIDALVRGSSYTLTLLDDIGGETLDAAA